MSILRKIAYGVSIVISITLGTTLWYDRTGGEEDLIKPLDMTVIALAYNERCLATQYSAAYRVYSADPLQQFFVYAMVPGSSSGHKKWITDPVDTTNLIEQTIYTGGSTLIATYSNWYTVGYLYPLLERTTPIYTYDYDTYIMGDYSNLTVSGFIGFSLDLNGTYTNAGTIDGWTTYLQPSTFNTIFHNHAQTIYTDYYLSYFEKPYPPWITAQAIDGYGYDGHCVVSASGTGVKTNAIKTYPLGSADWHDGDYVIEEVMSREPIDAVYDACWSSLFVNSTSPASISSITPLMIWQPGVDLMKGNTYTYRRGFFIPPENFDLDEFDSIYDLRWDSETFYSGCGITGQSVAVNSTYWPHFRVPSRYDITYLSGKYSASSSSDTSIIEYDLDVCGKALYRLKSSVVGGYSTLTGEDNLHPEPVEGDNYQEWAGYGIDYASAVADWHLVASYPDTGQPYAWHGIVEYPGVCQISGASLAMQYAISYLPGLTNTLCFYAQATNMIVPPYLTDTSFDAFGYDVDFMRFEQFEKSTTAARTNYITSYIIGNWTPTVPPDPPGDCNAKIYGFIVQDQCATADWDFLWCTEDVP